MYSDLVLAPGELLLRFLLRSTPPSRYSEDSFKKTTVIHRRTIKGAIQSERRAARPSAACIAWITAVAVAAAAAAVRRVTQNNKNCSSRNAEKTARDFLPSGIPRSERLRHPVGLRRAVSQFPLNVGRRRWLARLHTRTREPRESHEWAAHEWITHVVCGSFTRADRVIHAPSSNADRTCYVLCGG